ncbi:anthranilate phosphoribosyltransferase [Marinibactrum halimedae]|uniref:Anthranilate phosphoribosyltransferase n=1 Tax=Marinibactrum halimedae TaxID=1444977 RepID=A0AA37WLZ2_9GAMM|nr:anthranilate phosphoribosyltransferase [Marinibactrum halimedae]MCD9459573.1 anthranilate phosphoribosyltransferase [Marinibactrum halimedae]GLS25610.1 anthranilate phosphoribosyltransferase [Marinibactrum halimedae]
MEIKEALNHLVSGQSLSTDDMIAVMQQVMTGKATPAQIGALLIALRLKGETIDELTGAATVMRTLAAKVSIGNDNVIDTCLVDTCGTGGDGANLFNVSTAAAFVVAAAGGSVAKHGNRSVSSSTGSADVLEAAGVDLSLTPEQVGRCVEELGVGFMFAPAHHSAMKHAIGPRRELGLRTIFNLLGPMTNPAGVKHQVIGVFDAVWCKPMAEVLKRLGSEHVLVVHAQDGLDEISIASPSHIAELKNGEITEYSVTPEDFGMSSSTLDGLSVENAQESLSLIKSALTKGQDERSQRAADIIALNAGAAIYVGGVASSLKEGVLMAQDAIGSGLAKSKLNELVSFTGLLKTA